MLYVCVAVLGLVAVRQLAVDLMPEVDMPRISISTTYEGVAPEEMETLITRPVEQALSTVTGLDKLTSMSAEGMSSIQAQFDWGVDLNEVVNDIREQLDFVRGMLPDDASEPTLFKFNLSDMPVVFLGLSGEGDARQVRHLAEQTISRRLERLQGVASVEVQGGRVREIQVQLAADRMAALGITPSEVTMALSRENRNVSAGDMLETGREVLIRAIGEFERKVDVENTIVAIRDGRPILVRDVGRVDDGIREMTNRAVDQRHRRHADVRDEAVRHEHRRGRGSTEARDRRDQPRLRRPRRDLGPHGRRRVHPASREQRPNGGDVRRRAGGARTDVLPPRPASDPDRGRPRSRSRCWPRSP